jgi:hypothetical protein
LYSEPKILTLEDKEQKLQRKSVVFESRDKEFLTIYANLSSQFFSLYQHRLHTIAPALRKQAAAKWPGMHCSPHPSHLQTRN